MLSLTECPNCGRKAKDTFYSNCFPVHACTNFGPKYYDDCSDDDNPQDATHHHTQTSTKFNHNY